MPTRKVDIDSRVLNKLLFYLLVFENLEHLGLPLEVRVGSKMFLGLII